MKRIDQTSYEYTCVWMDEEEGGESKDCVKKDMKEKGFSDIMTVKRMHLKKETCCADPK